MRQIISPFNAAWARVKAASQTIAGAWTFTANVILNGSNNTAPAQVGQSPQSATLMTRAQGDIRYRKLPPLLAGRVWPMLPTQNGISPGTTTPAANEIEYQPFYVPYDITLTALVLNVATIGSADSRARVALYNDNGSCAPGSLISGTDVGEVSMDTLGDRDFTLSSPLALAPGLYWKAARFNNPVTRPVMRTVAGTSLVGVMGNLSGGSLTHVHYYGTTAFGAFPSTASVGSPIYVHNPFLVALKLSSIG